MTISNQAIQLAILFFVFNLKHLLADYPLQGRYMLGKFKEWPEFILPLAAHSGVHSVFTFVITWVYISLTGNITSDRLNLLFYLPLLDFMAHFVMDRIKADGKLLGRFESMSKFEMKKAQEFLTGPSQYASNAELRRMQITLKEKIKSNTYFWWSLGFDQFIHHTTDLLICLVLIFY